MREQFKRKLLWSAASLMLVATTIGGAPHIAAAQDDTAANSGPLVITDKPLPKALQTQLYSKPSRADSITAEQVISPNYYNESGKTSVGRKVDELRSELLNLQGLIANLSQRLASIEQQGQKQAASYYASVATISTQLQSGTTPGNPRLVARLTQARKDLEQLDKNLAELNTIAVEISNTASMSSYILTSARSAYGISGAVEEDHVRLAQLEDTVSKTVVAVERLSANVNDDISRTSAYLDTERANLRTLALAISSGDMFGNTIAKRTFGSMALPSTAGLTAPAANIPAPAYVAASPAPQMPGTLSGPRPLVKIKFDKQDVSYEQPVYMAVNEALARFPNARFELVAVHPSQGNAAEVAIESTRARRNAERVLRSLSQMGMPLDRVELSYTPSAEAVTNEVHLYVR